MTSTHGAPPRPSAGMPDAEIAIDTHLVRALLREQHPDLTDAPLALLAEGWDTMTFRLGDDLIVRMPRRAIVGRQIVNEQQWLPLLAPRLPLPISAPVRIGRPNERYPWPWSVLRYLPGSPVDDATLAADDGATLGRFLRALHHAPPGDAPTNEFRGGPLADRRGAFDGRAQSLAARGLLAPDIERIWRAALDAPIDVEPVWIHGDLHPLNVLAHAGRLSAVIDWIDLCAGDPATDLAALWALPLTRAAREAALAAYGDASVATLERARGWACYFGVMHYASGLENAPRHARIGARILRDLADDA